MSSYKVTVNFNLKCLTPFFFFNVTCDDNRVFLKFISKSQGYKILAEFLNRISVNVFCSEQAQ